jgi:uncharacterized phage protein (TIGR01671 family)
MSNTDQSGRVIKFRAWPTTYGKFESYSLDQIISGKVNLWFFKESPVIHQFTGLLDKNGKEIYEGDIIEGYVSDEDDYGEVLEKRLVHRVVEWQDGVSHHLPHKDDNPSTANCNPQFIGKLIDGYDDGAVYWSEFHNCEVIGNIYEHPNLLNHE